MSFLSANFAPFLVLSLFGYHIASKPWRPCILLAASVCFYAAWSLPHTGLLLGITGVVYLAALLIGSRPNQRNSFTLTILAITGLLMVLTLFKCGQWFADHLPGAPNEGMFGSSFLMVVPLGLSYYLFKLIGYLLDVYWEKFPPQKNFVALALYASFFPQMISGPIQRADDFFDQLRRVELPDAAEVVGALRRILFGVFKKVVIADQLGVIVDRIFANPSAFSALELLLGAYCFALQIYADFSGLTDMAIGIGRLFGITGPENFNLPYWSRNLQEFWRHWHMSLTSWLTDYLFTPLRMAFRNLGNLGLSLAIFINMLVIGVWHGPLWTYVAFGSLHGVFMIISALTLKKRNAFFKRHQSLATVRRFSGPICTFHLVVFALIFFRSASLRAAMMYVVHLFGLSGTGIAAARLQWSLLGLSLNRFAAALLGLAVMEVVDWYIRKGREERHWHFAPPRIVRWAAYYAIILLVLFTTRQTQTFIYGHF